jgi:hypothetical protein
MSFNPYSIPASMISKVDAAREKAIKTGGKFKIGDTVTISGGTYGRKFKGTIARKNMVRVVSDHVGKIVDITKYWTGRTYSRRYQVSVGKIYGKLWFNATQMR